MSQRFAMPRRVLSLLLNKDTDKIHGPDRLESKKVLRSVNSDDESLHCALFFEILSKPCFEST